MIYKIISVFFLKLFLKIEKIKVDFIKGNNELVIFFFSNYNC